MRRSVSDAAVGLSGTARLHATFTSPPGAMALPPQRKNRQGARHHKRPLAPLAVPRSSSSSASETSTSAVVEDAASQEDTAGGGESQDENRLEDASPSRGTMCGFCGSAIRKVPREGKPAGCDCTCMYCREYGHPVKSCRRKAVQMNQMDALSASASERAAVARAAARAADAERSLARAWHEAKAAERSELAQAEREAASERGILHELAAELQISREDIYERFRQHGGDVKKLQEALADERERVRQYRTTVATIYRASTPDRPSTPGTVFADAVDMLRQDKHFCEHANRRSESSGRQKQPVLAEAKNGETKKRTGGVVYTGNVQDGGIPFSYGEMLSGLVQRPSAARQLRRWGATQRQRVASHLVAVPRQLSKAGGALAAAVASMKRERLVVKPKSTVAEPTDRQLATFVGMGYTDGILARRAFALADGDFDQAIRLVQLWSAPLTLTLVEREESGDRTVKIDLPSLKNHGEIFLGTDESCDGRFLANDYTNALHARVRIGSVPGVGNCDLGREARGYGDFPVHIIDNRSKYGTFVNGMRVLGCANLSPGDIIVLGWKAAASTRRSQTYGPGFHQRSVKLRVDVGPAAVYTEEQHIKPTALLVATRKEYLKHEARQRTVPLAGGVSELNVPANHMAAGPTKYASAAKAAAVTPGEANPRNGPAALIAPVFTRAATFEHERRQQRGPRARKELQLGRPLTPLERHELVMGNQVPASEIKAAIESGLKVGKGAVATKIAKERYAQVLMQTAEQQREEEAAEQARQQALVEEEHAKVAAEWREWRRKDLAVAQMAPKDRPTTPEVSKLLERWGEVEVDTSLLGPLYR